MIDNESGRLRLARAEDEVHLMPLWDLLFTETDATPETPWKRHALEWFSRHVNDSATARFPVIEANGEIVSAAIGTLELGVPNPYCPRDAPRGWRTL